MRECYLLRLDVREEEMSSCNMPEILFVLHEILYSSSAYLLKNNHSLIHIFVLKIIFPATFCRGN